MKQLNKVHMKSIYLYITSALFVLFAGLVFTGCEENKDEAAAQGLSIRVYSPIKVVEGQEVIITGTGFKDVNTVVFPGNISVSSFNKVSNNMIKVITPAGVSAAGGDLIVQAGNESATAHIPMTIGNPRIATMVPNDEAGIGREIIISGTDMEFYDRIIFPGKDEDIVVKAIDFERRSSIVIRVKVPAGIADGPARIRIVSFSGKEDLLPEIYLIGKTDVYIPPEYLLLCGTEGKSWTWDDTLDKVWGNGGFQSNSGPAWWTLSVDELRGQTQTESGGAEMNFNFDGLKMTKIRSNGTSVEGTFKLDMEKTVGDRKSVV